MTLLERRHSLISTLIRFIRTVLGLPPLVLTKCVNDKSTKDYKLYGQSVQQLLVPILPSEYQQVEYIKSTRTQYLDTGYVPKKNTRIELDLKFDGTFSYGLTSPASSTIFGVRDYVDSEKTTMARFAVNFGGASNQHSELYIWTYSDGSIITQHQSTTDMVKTRNKLIVGQGKFSYGGQEMTIPTADYDNIESVLLFGSKTVSGTTTYFASYDMYCYGCQFYEDDILIKDFKPCYRKSDGQIGMYDMVEGVFITNTDTDVFVKGGDADEMVSMNPTPDTPIEVESVGEKTINLFNPNEAILNGGSIDGSAIISKNIDYYLKAGTYTIAFTGVNTTSIYFRKGQVSSGYFYTASDTNNKRICNYFTFSEDDYLRLSHFSNGGIKDVMLLEGKYTADTMPDYEPYDKYKIPVIASGKNLFNINNVSGWKWNGDGGSYHHYDIFVGANQNVTVSWDNDLSLGQSFYLVIGYKSSHKGASKGTWLYHSSEATLCKRSIKVTADADGYIYLNFAPKRLDKLTTLQVEVGNQKTDYEPYQEPITTNIYLDEPLRKIGDYADYIDFENRVVVRNVKKSSLSIYGIYRKSSRVLKIHMTTGGLMGTKVLSTILPYNPSWYSNNEDIMSHQTMNNNTYYSIKWERLGLTFDGTDVYLIDDSEKNALTDAEIKSKVKEYLATLPTEQKELYFCISSTETPIELPQLPTFKGTTIYSVDTAIQPSNMEVTYYSKERSVS